MRFLAVLCALLLIANLAVLLWPDNARRGAHIYQAKSEVNPHFIRLNKEIEDKHLTAGQNTIVNDESSTLVTSSDGECFRLGPFMHRENYELAQAVLFNANINYQKSTRAAQESNMYRVYLGPYSDQAEAADMRVELKRKNILDHFIRKEMDKQFVISLGIYTTEDFANSAVSLFSDRLDSVKLKREQVVLPDSFWLHFAIDEQDQIRQQLVRMDWGEQSAKLGKYACLSS